ncbi:MAG: serine/threonine protein kinase, partial [Deltaproteobacteria bacterium]|nr:serine/threonine protein kinase [Deltaproteobacteria bacterium]
MTAPEPTRMVGQVLDGRYRLDALLGQGGMGAVFRAYHLAMERRVAVKVLRPHLVGDDTAARRFAREARGTFKVDSAHAVKVIDFAVADDGTLYMVMEYLDGRTVGAELEVDGPLGLRRGVHVAKQICDALAAAHRIGLVHRDIKPDNVLLQIRGSDSDFAKVLDFGLARIADDAASGPFSKLALTQGDMVFGTPDYMSPEQAKGQPLDGRSDLYAVGTTLFEMITGRCPFVEPSAILLLARHVQTPAPHLWDIVPELAAQPGAAEIDAVIQRSLAKSRDQRPATAEAMIAELDQAAAALDGRPRSRPSRSAASTMDLDPPAPRAPWPLSEAVAPVRPSRGPWLAAIAVGGAIAAVAVIAIAARKPK